ncbi:H-NS family nucleoid-associated regulatory protein [Burkholderia ubonensis]|uniref:H-NS histone family protein n=1 Tax=Burkholderia ubonensis TaxID=101571 RepID=UPI0008FE8F88|nr:H-NS histone family protein [Burkholderia ubonensis]
MKTYRELMEQLDQLRREIELVREYEAQRIAQRVLEVLADHGVSLPELTGLHPRGRRFGKKVEPKYYDPETGATWSGRGRIPRWLVGKDPEQYLIHHGNGSADSRSENHPPEK